MLLSPSYLNSKVNTLLPVVAAHPCSTPRSSSWCRAVLHTRVFPFLGLASFLHTRSSSCAKLLKINPPNPDPSNPARRTPLKKKDQIWSINLSPSQLGRRCLSPLWAHCMRMLMLPEGVTEFCSFLYPRRAFCCIIRLVIALKKPREARK